MQPMLAKRALSVQWVRPPLTACRQNPRIGFEGGEAMAREDEIRNRIREASRDGRVECRVLLDMARETGADPAELGRLCNEMRIRIRRCQLGCFP